MICSWHAFCRGAVRNLPESIARKLLGDPVCLEASSLFEPVEESPGESDEAMEGLQLLTDDELAEQARLREEAAAALAARKWASALPYDVEGRNCVDAIVLNVGVVASQLIKLRDAFLQSVFEEWLRREKRVRAPGP